MSSQIATSYGSTTSPSIKFSLNVLDQVQQSGPWLQNDYFIVRYTISANGAPNTSDPGQFTNYGSATGTMQIYPYRFSGNWCQMTNEASKAQLINGINGNNNYNDVDTGTDSSGNPICPLGKEFFSILGSISGSNVFFISGTNTSLDFEIANLDIYPNGWSDVKWDPNAVHASFTYDICIEVINNGANKSLITSSGFNINF